MTDQKRGLWWETGLVGLGVLLFHLVHVPAVARGGLFSRDNLAFDFDINRFVQLWGASPFPTAENEGYYAARHPLAVMLRLICHPLVEAGLDAHVVACGVGAICAALSAMLALRIARLLGVGRWLAYVMTALWVFSASSLVLGVLPETYGLAFVALGAQFLLSIRWFLGDKPALGTRIAVAVANFGITITNVVASGLGELIGQLGEKPLRRALVGTAGFSAAVAIVGVALGAISFHIWPVDHSKGSPDAVKQVYWDASSAERTQVRQSVGDVTWIFGASAFVAPPAAKYPSGVPGNPYLWDVRGYDYSTLGWAAVAGWLVLLLGGMIAAAKDRALRPLWIMAVAWIVANISLHSYWQFRDTLFLYAPHSHIAFFVLAIAGARWAQVRGGIWLRVYGAFATLVTVALAFNNLALYAALPVLN